MHFSARSFNWRQRKTGTVRHKGKYSNMNRTIPELLAPAGSFSIMKQAFQAGADAVYLGGTLFGARAYAANLTEEELLRGIEYGKLHQKKLYLTVNTLFKNEDIDRLFTYLRPLYEAGLDAVIVQDFGVLRMVRRMFPAMEIHASTQMSVTTPEGAALLKELGVCRIVPARELGIEELRMIKQKTGIELEVFVHGAFCYSYSGHCLLSSMIGGRSGNRGRCAQPCRQQYSLCDGRSGYYFSPRDLCALSCVPELIEAGMDSFKIEGRMKKPEYVIGAVEAYRRAIDAYREQRELRLDKERDRLADVYNRGEFTEGYFHIRNGAEMMAMERNHHNGIRLGIVHSVHDSQIRIRLERDLNRGDILEIRTRSSEIEITSGIDGSAGEIVSLKGKQLRYIHPGDMVYRTKNSRLCDELLRNNASRALKENINVSVTLKKDLSAMIRVACREHTVTVRGGTVTAALRQPLTREMILEKINKLGDAPFVIASVEIDMEEDVFYPMKEWNRLRRQALTELEQQCCMAGRRSMPEPDRFHPEYEEGKAGAGSEYFEPKLALGVSTREQFAVGIETEFVERMDLEAECFTTRELEELLCAVHQHGKTGYISLPRMLRMEYSQELLKLLELPADGYVVRTVDSLALVREQRPEAVVVCDFSVYSYNREAATAYSDCTEGELFHTLPVELNREELQELIQSTPSCSWEWILYGTPSVMVSTQCFYRNTNADSCRRDDADSRMPDPISMVNSHGDRLRVQPVCKYCYNVVYLEPPVCLVPFRNELSFPSIRIWRILLTSEDRTETEAVLGLLTGGRETERVSAKQWDRNENTGHYRKGIE